jgi:hypothetical protein
MCCSIEEILAESEESDLEVDTVCAVKLKKKKALSTWIHEDADNIVDFTDRTAARKITGLYSDFLLSVYSFH